MTTTTDVLTETTQADDGTTMEQTTTTTTTTALMAEQGVSQSVMQYKGFYFVCFQSREIRLIQDNIYKDKRCDAVLCCELKADTKSRESNLFALIQVQVQAALYLRDQTFQQGKAMKEVSL